MGGDYYDRSVYSTSNTSSSNTTTSVPVYSKRSDSVMKKTQELKKSVDPRRFASITKITTKHSNPIVVALDVTGSMGDWTKIIYDKLPMFYGQIMMQSYCEDPAISFCGVGDAYADDAPLQVTEFAQGSSIDSKISNLFLEAGGGGGYKETYELAAYFYANRCNIRNAKEPFFFLTGDELFYPSLSCDHIQEFIGVKDADQSAKSVFAKLKKVFKNNVFLLHKPYWKPETDNEIVKKWKKILGHQNVLILEDPKAIVDVMLGVISIKTETRNLKTYMNDMKNRGQLSFRCEEVAKCLQPICITSEEFDSNLQEFEKPKQKPKQSSSNPPPSSIKELKEKLAKLDDSILIPDEFMCPITQEVMIDPVITDDGHTYEKMAIKAWFTEHNTSPVTNEELFSKKLRPNHSIRKLISDFISKNTT